MVLAFAVGAVLLSAASASVFLPSSFFVYCFAARLCPRGSRRLRASALAQKLRQIFSPPLSEWLIERRRENLKSAY
jgi:hypothetical protein